MIASVPCPECGDPLYRKEIDTGNKIIIAYDHKRTAKEVKRLGAQTCCYWLPGK